MSIIDPALWNALTREATLAAQHLGIGATALGRANYAAPALYSQAFFALSVGLERSAKLAIALDYAIEHDGEYPLARHYRTFGHKIDRLLAAVDQIARRRELERPRGFLPDTAIHRAIIETLSEFASNVTRYYNLELLAAGDAGLDVADPIDAWHSRVTRLVLDQHYSERQRERDGVDAARAQFMLGPVTAIRHVHESGSSIESIGDAHMASMQGARARPWERMYVLQIGRFVGGAVTDLGWLAQSHGLAVPFLGEMFGIFNQDDTYFRRRKTWTIH